MKPPDTFPPGHSVSVVIPTHNRAELVGNAIESVLAQTVAPREVIVIDDDSTDRTKEVLAGFGDSIRAVRTEENVERGAARNLGAGVASGELLAFLDSDDLWEPRKLEFQLRATAGDVPSVTGVRLVDASGRSWRQARVPRPRSDDEILIQNYCFGGASSLLLPRAAFHQVHGFPEDRELQGSEDWILLIKLHWAGWPLAIVSSPLVAIRTHPGGSTQNPENLERSMWAASEWVASRRLGRPGATDDRQSRAATAIACAYIADGRPRRAKRWIRVSLSRGSATSRAHGAWWLFRTSGRRALRSLVGR